MRFLGNSHSMYATPPYSGWGKSSLELGKKSAAASSSLPRSLYISGDDITLGMRKKAGWGRGPVFDSFSRISQTTDSDQEQRSDMAAIFLSEDFSGEQ